MHELERQIWKIDIDVPVDLVWAAIVRTGEPLPFMFDAICETEPGGLQPSRPMRMVSSDGRNVIAYGEVLEVSPPMRFSHTIHFTMAPGEAPGCTTYGLPTTQGGTELTLVSEALPGTKTARMSKSGQFIVDNLKAVVETGRTTFRGRLALLMVPLMSLMTPATCRASAWPLKRVPIGEAVENRSGEGR